MPNDPNVIKEWQIYILRDDIKLKPGDVVCSLHLNSEDIIREKSFTGPNGSVVATVRLEIKLCRYIFLFIKLFFLKKYYYIINIKYE